MRDWLIAGVQNGRRAGGPVFYYTLLHMTVVVPLVVTVDLVPALKIAFAALDFGKRS